MARNIKKLLEEIEKLSNENKYLDEKLQRATEYIDAIKTGSIDALLIADKVWTEKTADKIYRILIEKMHEGAVALNEDGTILYCNFYFADMVNLPLQKVIGTLFINFIDNSSRERFQHLLKQGRENPIKEEFSIYTNDDRAIPVLVSVNTFSLDNTIVLSIILTDLTIQNKNQEELKFRTRESEQKNIELDSLNKELAFQNAEKEKRTAELMIANKELEQFSYIASHDLQEPLRTVSNYIQVFEEDYLEQLDANAHKYLHSVNNAIQRMKFLIKALLDFSLLGQNTKLIKVDFKKLIFDVMADLDTMIKTSNAAIEVTEMPQLNVYEIEMRQLFQNLISNAIKFAKKHTQPEIRISSEKINGKWKFSVSDKGIGIAPEHFERVFDIFQRLPTDENHGGNGIGLANCKKIVQLHQGEIWVESNQAQGTIFHFTIPSLKI